MKRGRGHKNTLDDFWARVSKSEGCWEWKGKPLKAGGYGRFRWSGPSKRAHCFSFELHYGPIPEGLCVCHHCDNPKCVRPDHLFVGTPQDNNRDKVLKGRQASGDRNGSRTKPECLKRGIDHGRAKLTEKDVLEIRANVPISNMDSIREVASKLAVTPQLVRSILNRKIWRHL